MSPRIFLLSDHTGLTIGAMARALLAQFPDLSPQYLERPFLDEPDRLQRVAEEIRADPHCLVFSSLADPEARAHIEPHCPGRFFDVFATYTPLLARRLATPARPATGRLHGIDELENYQARLQAVDYSLRHDDGAAPQGYPEADLILVGVSRCGKTPTCLYLALQHGLKAANHPLTAEELHERHLPAPIAPFQSKLVGLTIDPWQLHKIRIQRRPQGTYARLEQCQWEVERAQALFRRHRIPTLDTTAISVEEIATRILTQGSTPP